MSFYMRLQEQTEAERTYLLRAPIIRDCLAGRVRLPQYVAFLTEAYHHVEHTVPLMMECGSQLPERAGWLRGALAEYIQEESGHQEWILDDLAACGANPDAVRAGKPQLWTELMVSYAYDTIRRGNPVGFFGMVQVLEGTSTLLATQAADAIRRTLCLPENALSYLRSHGALDQEHIQFFARLMERIDDPGDQRAIVHTARVIYRLYAEMFRNLPTFEATEGSHAA